MKASITGNNIVIHTTPGYLDDVKQLMSFKHFTIGPRGKAIYHWLTLANNSCGLYYAWREHAFNILSARRTVEPITTINVHGTLTDAEKAYILTSHIIIE